MRTYQTQDGDKQDLYLLPQNVDVLTQRVPMIPLVEYMDIALDTELSQSICDPMLDMKIQVGYEYEGQRILNTPPSSEINPPAFKNKGVQAGSTVVTTKISPFCTCPI